MHTPETPEAAAYVWSVPTADLLPAVRALYDLAPAPLPADVALSAAWLGDELARRTPGLDEAVSRVLAEGAPARHFGDVLALAAARVGG